MKEETIAHALRTFTWKLEVNLEWQAIGNLITGDECPFPGLTCEGEGSDVSTSTNK